MPRAAGDPVPGEVADRSGPVGPELTRLAPRLDHRRRRVRPARGVPRRLASASRTLRAGCPLQHHGPGPPAAAATTPEGWSRPETRGAVRAGRRLGGEPAGVAVGADHR